MTQWKAPKNTALVIVDMTYDFLPPDGALMVQNGDELIPVINKLVPHFHKRVWTKEEHHAHHAFFASSHPGKKPLETIETKFGTQYLWPDHCVLGTKGAEFHKDLDVRDDDLIVVKGTDRSIHAYSAVYMDDRKTIIRYPNGETLPDMLRARGIDRVVCTGLAYDFCAGLTAYDLAKEGFDALYIRDANHSICIPTGDGKTTVNLMDEMLEEAGVALINAAELPKALGVQTDPDNAHNVAPNTQPGQEPL